VLHQKPRTSYIPRIVEYIYGMLRSIVVFYSIIASQAFCPLQNPKFSLRLHSKSGNFDSLTVPELKDELRSRGLTVGGNKSALIERLIEHGSFSEETTESKDGELRGSDEESPQHSSAVDISETASFDELGIMPELLTSIESQRWEEPTPIQGLVIPEIMNQFKFDSDKCSLWAEAPTGSGKTGAFVIPMIQLTLENRKLERNRSISQKHSYSEGGHNFQKNLGRGRGRHENDEGQTKGFVSTLILCPTRELAMQIGGVAEELVEGMTTSRKDRDNVDVVVITGGVPREAQVQMLAERKLNNRNVDILVATPGRLADVLLRSTKEDSVEKELENRLLLALDQVAGNAKNDVSLSLAQLDDLDINKGIAEADDGGRSAIKNMLSNVQYLVLDEADRLLSQGFKSEMDDVLKLLPRTSKPDNDDSSSSLKTLLFSATFPEQIQPRVEKVLQRLGGKGAPPPLRISCSPAGYIQDGGLLSNRQQKRKERTTQPQAILEGPASTIDLRSIRIDEEDRTQALRRLLRQYGEQEWDRVLVFVDTRYASEHVALKLRRYNIRASELHGKLDQDARNRRLEDFKSGKIRVLIATDLASRGLDVQGLPAVVNYDLPRSTADFTHRIGRTGRAGNKGVAVTFITSTNEAHYDLIEKRHLGKKSVEREVLAGFEPHEAKWELKRAASDIEVNGVKHSEAGIAHDRMFGGMKGKRKSKKDRLREKAAREAAKNKN
jgi:superfamily II DNA/RNA helicase